MTAMVSAAMATMVVAVAVPVVPAMVAITVMAMAVTIPVIAVAVIVGVSATVVAAPIISIAVIGPAVTVAGACAEAEHAGGGHADSGALHPRGTTARRRRVVGVEKMFHHWLLSMKSARISGLRDNQTIRCHLRFRENPCSQIMGTVPHTGLSSPDPVDSGRFVARTIGQCI
jgi:hypothetical protein